MRARHRVSKLLLRQGIHYNGGNTWTQAHMSWLYRQRFDSPALQLAYDLALETIPETLHRRDRLDKAITKIAYDSEYTPLSGHWSACAGSQRSRRLAWPWR